MVKRFMAPGPWITRDLKECVLASDYDALAAENAALQKRIENCVMELDRRASALRSVSDERDALHKGAERYREWRRAFRDGECGLYNALCDAGSEAEHDAAIDAAMEGSHE